MAVRVVLVVFIAGREDLYVVCKQAIDRRPDGPFELVDRFASAGDDLDDVAHAMAEEILPTAALAWMEQIGAFGVTTSSGDGPVVTVAYSTVALALLHPPSGVPAAVKACRRVDVAHVLDADVDDETDSEGTPSSGDVEIVRAAHARLQERIEREPIALGFLTERFTLGRLRQVYEAVWNVALDPANFRRKVLAATGFVTATRSTVPVGYPGGRPALAYRSGGGGELRPPLYRLGLNGTERPRRWLE